MIGLLFEYKRCKINLMKKTFTKTSLILIALTASLSLLSCGSSGRKLYKDSKTPVERYGKLSVSGTNLCDQTGKPVQLCGMSSHGLHWYGKYANADVMKWLRDDWNADLWRSAMYVGGNGGYVQNRAMANKLIESIDAAIETGMYILVDWHVLPECDPLLYVKQSEEFFDRIASTYADCPNIIYEICNEPNGEKVTWEGNIKPYAERIIPIIRKYCDNVIVVGTPVWSSDLTSAAASPIENQKNIMYTLHFYAGSHGKDSRAVAEAAIKKGLPIFVTEWGTTQASGDGGVYEKETLEWMRFLAKNKISWANWSVNNKGEDSGALKYNKDRDAKGGWKESDLQPSGILVRKILRGEAK